jgi:hypothetical protein
MGSELEQIFCEDGEAFVRFENGDPAMCRRSELTPATAAPSSSVTTPAPPPAQLPPPAGPVRLDVFAGPGRVNPSTLTGGRILGLEDKTLSALDRAYTWIVGKSPFADTSFDATRPDTVMTTAQVYALKRRGFLTVVHWTRRDARGRRRPTWCALTAQGVAEARDRAAAAS